MREMTGMMRSTFVSAHTNMDPSMIGSQDSPTWLIIWPKKNNPLAAEDRPRADHFVPRTAGTLLSPLTAIMVEQSEPIALNDNASKPTITRNVTTSDLGRIPMQAVKNTVLKSHGRPPWYGNGIIPREVMLIIVPRYGEDGLPITDAFVVGIAGARTS